MECGETTKKRKCTEKSRSLHTPARKEKYFCKKDRRGVVYDRRAMPQVSRQLGHNRISVIAEHYLHWQKMPFIFVCRFLYL